MANTYTQRYVQIVFAVQGRQNLITEKWINANRWFVCKFSWQEGFGAFTYSKSQIDSVVKYILNHPEHHKKISFKDEYINLKKMK